MPIWSLIRGHSGGTSLFTVTPVAMLDIPPPGLPLSSPPPLHIQSFIYSSSGGESVDKWRRCALELSCLRSGEAIYERALAGFTVINRRRPPRPQAGQGQPALHCLDREITSKRPAACVKKILHSGSVQMNPGGAWNCFLMAFPSIYIITPQTWSMEVTNDICKCLCSVTPELPRRCGWLWWFSCLCWASFVNGGRGCCQWELTLIPVAALKIWIITQKDIRVFHHWTFASKGAVRSQVVVVNTNSEFW